MAILTLEDRASVGMAADGQYPGSWRKAEGEAWPSSLSARLQSPGRLPQEKLLLGYHRSATKSLAHYLAD